MKNTLFLISSMMVWCVMAQKDNAFNIKLPSSSMKVVKTGPLIGVEKGKYFNVNFGVERQWKQLKIVSPHTNAVNIMFDYNFRQETMGAQLGYWFQPSRFNLTYGARVVWCTNFNDAHRFGISPNVGYKLLQGHFQLGVHILTPHDVFKNTNTFYASLRWVFVNDRDVKRKH